MMGKFLLTLIVFGVPILSCVFAEMVFSEDAPSNKPSCAPIVYNIPFHINMTCISLGDGTKYLTKFDHLNSLKVITLIRNKLTKFPSKFCALFQELLVITVKEQHIRILSPDSFLNITSKLQRLILNDNGVKFIEAATFGRFKELRILQLTGNHLEVLHSDTFVGLEELEQLHLYDNRITAVGPSVFTHRHLSWLDLEKNQLQYLPPRIFSELKQLKYLKLYGNPLSALPKSLIPRHQLFILTITFNDNVKVESGAFHGVNTETLRLNGDQLRSIHVGTFNGLITKELILLGNDTNHFNISKNLFKGCRIETLYCYVKNFNLHLWFQDIQRWGFKLTVELGLKRNYDHHTYLDRVGYYEADQVRYQYSED